MSPKYFIFALFFSLSCSYSFAQVFSTKGHAKSNGVKIEITYNDNWTTKEGIRPHIVQVFNDNDGWSSCALTIQPALDVKLTKPQWESAFNNFTITEYEDAIEGFNLKNYKKTAYEGYAGVLIEFDGKKSRAGIDRYIHGLLHMFGYKENLIMLHCIAGGLTKENADKSYHEHFYDFLQFGNNVLLPDEYEIKALKTTKITTNEDNFMTKDILILLLSTTLFIFFMVFVKILAEKIVKKVLKSKNDE